MLSVTTENQIRQEWQRKADHMQPAADPNLYTVFYEYTDTFGGEANYSWVKRGEFQDSLKTPDALIVKKAKALVGLTGITCKRTHYGDMIELRPYGSATVLFITWS